MTKTLATILIPVVASVLLGSSGQPDTVVPGCAILDRLPLVYTTDFRETLTISKDEVEQTDSWHFPAPDPGVFAWSHKSVPLAAVTGATWRVTNGAPDLTVLSRSGRLTHVIWTDPEYTHDGWSNVLTLHFSASPNREAVVKAAYDSIQALAQCEIARADTSTRPGDPARQPGPPQTLPPCEHRSHRIGPILGFVEQLGDGNCVLWLRNTGKTVIALDEITVLNCQNVASGCGFKQFALHRTILPPDGNPLPFYPPRIRIDIIPQVCAADCKGKRTMFSWSLSWTAMKGVRAQVASGAYGFLGLDDLAFDAYLKDAASGDATAEGSLASAYGLGTGTGVNPSLAFFYDWKSGIDRFHNATGPLVGEGVLNAIDAAAFGNVDVAEVTVPQATYAPGFDACYSNREQKKNECFRRFVDTFARGAMKGSMSIDVGFAQCILGEAYNYGTLGYARNPSEALIHYCVALKLGWEPMRNELKARGLTCPSERTSPGAPNPAPVPTSLL